MGKKYQSVSELVGHLTNDKKLQAEFEREVADKNLAKTLFSMRCSKGLTQADMAKRIDCTQSRVSKLEDTPAADIRVGDLMSYAKALDLNLSIGFHPEMTSAECVKLHAFEIKRHLDLLAQLAHRDDAIFEGVKKFFAEALDNILSLFTESAKKLPKAPARKHPLLEVSSPMPSSHRTELERHSAFQT